MNDPKHIGPYKIVRSLGAGGMGVVYLAHPKRKPRHLVAIKVLQPDYVNNAEAKARFVTEIESLKALRHKHIVSLLDFNIEGDVVWFAMPYFPRGTLKDALRQGKRFAPREVCKLLSQVANAIDYAHDQKYLHRDVKPENILLDEYGNAVLTDFGIAKHEDSDNLTNPGLALGTAKYMSRTRKAGAPATRQTDVYALGVIIYQLLSGDIRLLQIEETWLYTAIPAPLMEVVAKAAAEREEDSFESAGEFARAFEVAIGEPCDAEATDSGPITAPVERDTFATAITPRIARSVMDAISRSVPLSTPFTPPARGQRALANIILILVAVGVFGMIALMIQPEFGFLSQPNQNSPASNVVASPSTSAPIVQLPSATALLLPSATSTPIPTQPVIVVATTALPTTPPTASPLPPTLTPTGSFTPTVLPPTATSLPSPTSTPTVIPVTDTPTPTPSPTRTYYSRKAFILENTLAFDMVSLPSTSPCTAITTTSPDDCGGKTLWIDLVPVSVAQYQLCVFARVCPQSANEASMGPVTGINWLNAAGFCAWRGSRLPNKSAGRLPTDVEIGLLMAHVSETHAAASPPEWLGLDKQGMLIPANANSARAAVWDGTLPFQLSQIADEPIENNRNFTFRCVMYQP